MLNIDQIYSMSYIKLKRTCSIIWGSNLFVPKIERNFEKTCSIKNSKDRKKDLISNLFFFFFLFSHFSINNYFSQF